jgi:hypothetical protein
MDANQFRLTETPINVVVEAIRAQIESLTDLDNQTLFQSVALGLEFPQQDPGEEVSPSVRLWVNQAGYEVESVQFFVGKIEFTLDIYLVMYSFDRTDIQAQRERVCRHLLKMLEYPESGETGTTGLANGVWWEVISPQTIVVDHTSPYKKVAEFIPVLPPWYISRLSIGLRTHHIEL